MGIRAGDRAVGMDEQRTDGGFGVAHFFSAKVPNYTEPADSPIASAFANPFGHLRG
jgi:hypothetical protein